MNHDGLRNAWVMADRVRQLGKEAAAFGPTRAGITQELRAEQAQPDLRKGALNAGLGGSWDLFVRWHRTARTDYDDHRHEPPAICWYLLQRQYPDGVTTFAPCRFAAPARGGGFCAKCMLGTDLARRE